MGIRTQQVGAGMTSRTVQPSALPADVAERLSDTEPCYAVRPRNRLVIDLDAHRHEVDARDRELQAYRRAVEDAIRILRGEA